MHGEKSKEWKKERFLMRKFKILCQEMEIHRALRIRDLDLKKNQKSRKKWRVIFSQHLSIPSHSVTSVF